MLEGYKRDVAERDEKIREFEREVEIARQQVEERDEKIKGVEEAEEGARK
jgi:hypothetical protein